MPPRRDADTVRPRIEALYQQPSAAFVAARNALASALKKEGHGDASARVKRLQKPSPGAWALNQVYWRDRPLYDRLVEAGDRLRTLQHQMLSGRAANPREAMGERQSAVDAVVGRAAAFLKEDGNPMTAATRQRLQTTVDAVAAYGSAADTYTPGQLVEDVDAPGFAALASLGGGALRLVHGAGTGRARGSGGPATPSRSADAPAGPVDRKAGRAADKAREATAKREAAERAKAVKAAEQALRDATSELDTLRQRATRARSAAETLAQEQRTLEESLAKLSARRRAADAAAVEASEAVVTAERVRREAEAALAATRVKQG
jgi:hypothetical protein